MLKNSPRYLTAVAWAEAGIPVFPCVVNGKTPATPHGFKDRTTLRDRIDLYWSNEDFNLAIVPEDLGCFVVDIDNKHNGLELWQNLIHDKFAPPTRTIVTPSGGLHLYFRGSLPPSAGRCGKGIDIRGRGSYVLIPPSIVSGREYRPL